MDTTGDATAAHAITIAKSRAFVSITPFRWPPIPLSVDCIFANVIVNSAMAPEVAVAVLFIASVVVVESDAIPVAIRLRASAVCGSCTLLLPAAVKAPASNLLTRVSNVSWICTSCVDTSVDVVRTY